MRRIAVSASLFSFALILSGIVVGAVEGQNEAPPLVVPIHHVGDIAVYNVTAGGPGGQHAGTLVLQWLDRGQVVDEHGEVASARLLRAEHEASNNATGVAWTLAVEDAGDVIMEQVDSQVARGWRARNFLAQTSPDDLADVTSRSYDADFLCDLQGRADQALELGPHVRVRGACTAASGGVEDWVLMQRLAWNGLPSVQYGADHGGRMTWASGVAFPVVLEGDASLIKGLDAPPGTAIHLDLIGYVRGANAYDPTDADEPAFRPQMIRRIPGTQIWDGWADGLSYTAALQAALADDDEPAMAPFMERAGAYIGHAQRTVREDGDGRASYEWLIVATTGTEHLAKIVVEYPLQPFFPGPLRDQTVVSPRVNAFGGELPKAFPPEELLPSRIVDLPWALHQAQRFPGVVAANAWGFTATCTDNCSSAAFLVVAGETHLPSNQTSLGTAGVPWSSNLVSFHHTGLAVDQLTMQGAFVPPLHEFTRPPGDPARDAMPLANTPDGWQLPSTTSMAAVGFGAFLLAALYQLWPQLKVTVASLLTWQRHPLLQSSPARRNIVDLVRSNPGIHFRELARRVDVARGTLEHHLSLLVDGQVLVREAGHGVVSYFVNGQLSQDDMAMAPVLRSATGRRILLFALESPGRRGSEVAHALGLSPATVSHHVQRLRGAGLLDSRHGLVPTARGRRVFVLLE